MLAKLHFHVNRWRSHGSFEVFVMSDPWSPAYLTDSLHSWHKYNPWGAICGAPFWGQKVKGRSYMGRSKILPLPSCCRLCSEGPPCLFESLQVWYNDKRRLYCSATVWLTDYALVGPKWLSEKQPLHFLIGQRHATSSPQHRYQTLTPLAPFTNMVQL